MLPSGGVLSTDRIAPTVSLTVPANGDTKSGSMTLTATAADNDKVASVEFLADGSHVTTITTAPYTFSVDTHSYANGSHSVTAIAKDRVGNQVSVTNTYTISNTTPGAGDLDFGTWEVWNDDDSAYEGGRNLVKGFGDGYDWIWENIGSKHGALYLPSNPDPTHYQMRVYAVGGPFGISEGGTDGNVIYLTMMIDGVVYYVWANNDQGVVVNVNGGEAVQFDIGASNPDYNTAFAYAKAHYDFVPISPYLS